MFQFGLCISARFVCSSELLRDLFPEKNETFMYQGTLQDKHYWEDGQAAPAWLGIGLDHR